MSTILLKNGRLIDPSQQTDRVTSVLLKDGVVASLDAGDATAEYVIDVTGKIIAPGLVDMHVQLREPGCEEDETIASGAASAIAGGFTSIACIPNTEPPLDTAAGIEYVRHKAARADKCNVYVIACVSSGRKGEQLSEIGTLVEAGAVGFSDASRPIANPELLRRALEYTQMFDKPVLNRPELVELTHNGVMHDGMVSLVLGLAPLPVEAEEVMAARDICLCEATGGRLHLMSVSSSGTIEILRRAKLRGVRTTAEIHPCNFSLTDEALRSFDPNCKVNPPLRSADHIEACIAALADGTIDVISSGHAPRASEKKMHEMTDAPFGIVSLETTLGLTSTKLVQPGHLTWSQAIDKLSTTPAKILGLSKGTLAVGADADVTVIDPNLTWTVDASKYLSRSSNCPFDGWELTGKAIHVIVGGVIKM
ncbi:dihydroorotase [Blastopirellula sp. JC732]|uniref:Dihydroorotase n=1 Tax=Blastopirellula sediminis TaxID=2894196 RepID=A0A9X1MPR9_9BACT|nr:dihydroorotase [Blastopirellula sediminis]MCC9605612.1 dihydroorotase [Blastopirellula sediminis]MCC9631088.1 dihydroorotase [Blastopirellula sediminis]